MNNANRPLPPLTAARQTQEMVGQREALDRIRRAIYADGDTFRVVFVRADGGMGKTRLLEEVLKSVEEEWKKLGNAAVSNLIDVIDIRLHARDRFIRALYDSLRRPGGIAFRTYDRALDELTVLRAAGARLSQMQEAVQEATKAFIADLESITRRQRVVWIVDTVEQLRYISEQLLEAGLLEPDDQKGRTHQWLRYLISKEPLKNITLVLAGRGEEGEMFFESMKTAVSDARAHGLARELDDIEIKPLTPAEIRQYFANLAQDWANNEQSEGRRIAKQFEWIATKSNDRAEVLWLYTAGIPVRLALYAQLIVEGRDIPAPLKLSESEAFKEANIDSSVLKAPERIKPTPELRSLQWDIEDKFINLLFKDPTDLRARILQALVRAPRGLSAEQLHFLLDNDQELTPAEWQNDPRRLQTLTATLQEMTGYYLIKQRSDWNEFRILFAEEKREAATFRLGLQDEIYRIFAEHMAPHSEPQRPEVTAIWEKLPPEEQERYKKNRAAEREERQEQYRQLRDWANHWYEFYLQKKRTFMLEDERKLELQLVPDRPRTFYFEQLGVQEAQRRVAITQAIYTFEIEAMVYDLLLDPERKLNSSYIDLGTKKTQAGQEEIDFWAQSEMWQITHNADILRFVNFRQRKQARQYGETMVDVLHRAVAQEDVSRWLKRFVLREEYSRAVEFGAAVEKMLHTLPKQTRIEKRIWYSWNHTLVATERRIWILYAYIYLSHNTSETLAELKEHIARLEILYDTPIDRPAIKREDGHIENGFAGTVEQEEHPAYIRVRRLISLAYNVLGYGCIMMGQVRNAVKYDGRSLYFIRGDKEMDDHRGYVLNDLARALSDFGRNSISVCLDGLNLRRTLAEEVPLAISYNTLALIYDDMDRYEDAPELAAKAIAYLRRAGARRELGLALTQMGESLRHLAIRAQRGEKAQATPDTLYSAAETLLREARTIFAETEEISRLIIVLIELGSLYRDRLRTYDTTVQLQRRQDDYRETLVYLQDARQMAQERGLNYLEIDALVNIAWAHFHAEAYEKVAHTIAKTKDRIDDSYLIEQNSQPTLSNKDLVDIYWTSRQLSKLEMVRGQTAIAQFNRKDAVLKEKYPGEENAKRRHKLLLEDKHAKGYLATAAEAYALSLGYAYLLSPGNRMIDFTLDDLYNRIRAFNHLELSTFHEQISTLQREYQGLGSIPLLDSFLHDFFGIPGHDTVNEEEAT